MHLFNALRCQHAIRKLSSTSVAMCGPCVSGRVLTPHHVHFGSLRARSARLSDKHHSSLLRETPEETSSGTLQVLKTQPFCQTNSQ